MYLTIRLLWKKIGNFSMKEDQSKEIISDLCDKDNFLTKIHRHGQRFLETGLE